ncbi:MAG: hypothetical protein J6U09_04525 [Lachnospiraceae bacterium]|nr:hypothetical protein [Lachnospiraceae bacterium]
MKTIDNIKELNVKKIKELDPKEYICLLSHALRLGALYKAKFFMWLHNANYELISLDDDEAIEHFIKELLSVHKKALTEADESNLDFLDNVFFLVFKETNQFSEADCISLSLVMLAYVSFKADLISNEEYLEIRDLLVPYKVMISQCKVKSEDLFKSYLSKISESDKVLLLAKLGKGIESELPNPELVKEGFKEITYDEKSWESA